MTVSTEALYAFNLLKSTNHSISDNDSYLLARLIDVEHKYSAGLLPLEGLAQQIGRCYDAAGTPFQVDRVCISFSPPYSRRLSVVSCWNKPGIATPELIPGYSCYIAQNSSLFPASSSQQKAPRLRTYSDIQKVLESFQQHNAPIQKTIGKLAEAGIRSGLSANIDIGCWGHAFVFLNSKEPGAFDHFENHDYLSTSLLRLVVASTLHASNLTTFTIEASLLSIVEACYLPNTFSTLHLEAAIKSTLRQRFEYRGEISVSASELYSVFFPSQTALLLSLLVLDSLSAKSLQRNIRVEVEFIGHCEEIQLRFDFATDLANLAPARTAILSQIAKAMGFRLTFYATGFAITASCLPASQKEVACGYSVLR